MKDLAAPKPPGKTEVEKPAANQARGGGAAVGATAAGGGDAGNAPAPTTASPTPAAPSGGNRIEGEGGYVYEVNNDKLYIVQSPRHAGEIIRLPVSQTNPGYSAIAAELARKGVKLPVAARGGVLDGPEIGAATAPVGDPVDVAGFDAGPAEAPVQPADIPYAPSRGPRNMSTSGISDDLQGERDSFLPESVRRSLKGSGGAGAGRSLAELTELALSTQS